MADIFDEITKEEKGDIFDKVSLSTKSAPSPVSPQPPDYMGIPAEAPTRQIMAEGARALATPFEIALWPLNLAFDTATGLVRKIPGMSQQYQPAAPESGMSPEPIEGASIDTAGALGELGKQLAIPSYLKGLGAIGRALGPTSVLQKIAGGRTPMALYMSALKPSSTLSAAERAELWATGKAQDLIVGSQKGAENIRGAIDNYMSLFDNAMDTAKATGQGLELPKIFNYMDAAAADFKAAGLDYSSIAKMKERLAAEYPSGVIPVDVARKAKTKIYQTYRDEFGTMETAEREGRKAFTQGVVQETAKLFPELTVAGEESRKLINLEEWATRAANRMENKDIVGIGELLAGVMGRAVGGRIFAATAFAAKRIADDPRIKSRIALALAKQGVPDAPAVVEQRLATILNPQMGEMSIGPHEVTESGLLSPPTAYKAPTPTGLAPHPTVSPGPEPNIGPPAWQAPQIVQEAGVSPESSKIGIPLIQQQTPEGLRASIPTMARDILKSTRGAREVTLGADINSLADAWKRVSSRLGYSHVPIADVAEEMGMSFDALKPVILRALANGEIVGSEASWTLGSANVSQKVRDATLELKHGIKISDIKLSDEFLAKPKGEMVSTPDGKTWLFRDGKLIEQ